MRNRMQPDSVLRRGARAHFARETPPPFTVLLGRRRRAFIRTRLNPTMHAVPSEAAVAPSHPSASEIWPTACRAESS